MTELIEKRAPFNNTGLVKLAREIAMDMRPLDEILEIHEITTKNWEKLKENTQFQALLQSEIEAWQAAANTPERVKLKSLAFVEEALPEFYARAHDPKEPLNAKVEVLKTIAKFAGVGGNQFDDSVGGKKFSVTINLGADQSLRIEKTLPTQVIEHEDGE
jgi:hypothetical protein